MTDAQPWAGQGVTPPPMAATPAEPLREATRRFLRPLVGVDPAQVRVFRGPAVGRLADALAADALAGPGFVALPLEVDETSPAGLGLIAHELAHVVATPAPARAGGPVDDVDDEERHAIAVEAATVELARRAASAPHRPADSPPAPTATAPVAPGAAAAGAVWGGLPAPWEPLPAASLPPAQVAPASPQAQSLTPSGASWEPLPPTSPPPASAASARPPAASPPQVSALPAPARPQPAAPGAPEAPQAPLRRADETRTLPAQQVPSARAEPAPAPEPDLDALARQVYTLLKQRLATERRRMS